MNQRNYHTNYEPVLSVGSIAAENRAEHRERAEMSEAPGVNRTRALRATKSEGIDSAAALPIHTRVELLYFCENRERVSARDSAVALGGLKKSRIATITLGVHVLHYVRVRVTLEYIILYVGPYHTFVLPN